MYRPGKSTPDMLCTIGGARVLKVIESATVGPRLSRYQPDPCSGLKPAECATAMAANAQPDPVS